MRLAGAPKLLPLIAGFLILSGAAGLTAQYHHDLPAFLAIVLLQGTGWVAAATVIRLRRHRRPALALILGTAALLRLLALGAPVFLSDDIYRYVWDGRVQAAGINPYRYIPTDPHLAPLRDEVIFPNINRSSYAPTIYPPVAQMLFLLANRLGCSTAFELKLVFVAIEAIGIWALLFVLRAIAAPQEQILLYAWHPLPVWEIAGSGHLDAAVVALVALALAGTLAGRRAWSGAALAAAVLVKFFPLVLAPALWRPAKSNFGDRRWLAAFSAVIAAAYLPYIGVGLRVLGFLPGYAAEENLASGTGFWLLDLTRPWISIPLAAYIALTGTVMAGLTVGALRRPLNAGASLPWAAALATAASFFASPHYAWYFVWLVPLLSVAPWWPGWWLTLAAVLLYWNPRAGHLPFWVGFTLYGGFAILVIIDMVRRIWFAEKPGERDATHRAR